MVDERKGIALFGLTVVVPSAAADPRDACPVVTKRGAVGAGLRTASSDGLIAGRLFSLPLFGNLN